jgi:hypothetical protein
LVPFVEAKSFTDATFLAKAVNETPAARTANISVNPILLSHAIHEYGAHVANKLSWTLCRNQAKGVATPAYWKFPKRSNATTIALPTRADGDAFGAVSPTAASVRSRTEAARCAVVRWAFGSKVELFNAARKLQDCFSVADVSELMLSGTVAHQQSRAARTNKKRNAAEGDEQGGGGKPDAVDQLAASASDPLNSPAVPAAAAVDPPEVHTAKPDCFDIFTDDVNSSIASPLPPQITGKRRLAVTLENTKAKFGGYTLAHVRAAQEGQNPSMNADANATPSIFVATPSVPVAQAVLGKLNPAQLEEMQRYTNALRSLGADNAAYYIQHGIPSMWARRKMVETHMSSLYEETCSSMLSEHHVADHLRLLASAQHFDWTQPVHSYTPAQAELHQKLQHSEARLEAARGKAVHWVETAAAVSSGGTVLTPAVVQSGIVYVLGGASVRAMQLGAHLTQAISHKTAKAILTGLVDKRQAQLADTIHNRFDASRHMDLLIADNYVPVQHRTYVGNDRPLTSSASTVALLFRRLAVDSSLRNAVGAPRPPVLVPIQISVLVPVLVSGGIIVPIAMRGVTDPTMQYQGLRNFEVLPNIDGRSSKYADTDKKLVGDTLEGLLHLPHREVALVVDTEYILALFRLLHLEPERLQNPLLCLCPFHIRMHVLQNLLVDPVFLVLLWYPYYYHVGLQKADAKKSLVEIVKAMKKACDAHDADAAAAAASASASASAPASAAAGDSTAAGDPAALMPSDATGKKSGRTGNLASSLDMLRKVIERELDATEEGLEHHMADFEQDVDISNACSAMFSKEEWVSYVQVVQRFIEIGGREAGLLFTGTDKREHTKNYARIQYLVLLLYAAYQRDNQWRGAPAPQHPVQPPVQPDAQPPAPPPTAPPSDEDNAVLDGWCTRTWDDYLGNGVGRMGIQPLSDIIRHGSLVTLLERLHEIAQYIAYCGREKVCRSLMGLTWVMHYTCTRRPDVLHTLLSNCCSLNDNFIENHNGLTQQCLPERQMQTPDTVSGAATHSQIKRDMMDSMEQSAARCGETLPQGCATADSSEAPGYGMRSFPGKPRSEPGGGGEVYLEETRHERGKSAERIAPVLQYLRRQRTLLNYVSSVVAAPSAGITTVAGMLAHGAARIEGSYAPRYVAYLNREVAAVRRKQGAAAEHEPEDGAGEFYDDDHAYLTTRTVAMLGCFLKGKGYTNAQVAKLSSPKDTLVRYILSHYGLREYLVHMLDNKIDSSGDAQAYVPGASGPAAAAAVPPLTVAAGGGGAFPGQATQSA